MASFSLIDTYTDSISGNVSYQSFQPINVQCITVLTDVSNVWMWIRSNGPDITREDNVVKI